MHHATEDVVFDATDDLKELGAQDIRVSACGTLGIVLLLIITGLLKYMQV